MTSMPSHGSLFSFSGLQVYVHQALIYYWQDYLGFPSKGKGQWGGGVGRATSCRWTLQKEDAMVQGQPRQKDGCPFSPRGSESSGEWAGSGRVQLARWAILGANNNRAISP